MANDVSFSISLTGETTGEKHFGKFKAKSSLTHGDYLLKDKVRRQLLGNMGGTPDPRAANLAVVCSELSIRLTEAPKWWAESDNGLNLYDDNLLAKVFEEAIRIEREANEERAKAVEAAKGDIKEELKNEVITMPDLKL